ncbi:hypothetical protein acdb102_06190 [Acidothermaceae bacterium B102]|nr:hypothetical protein acdb102_06190 [Acidothermaceae bacterium B102]
MTAAPLDVTWIRGSDSSKHNADPDIQVYRHDERSVILRQNKAVNYEAPFLFLLTGDDRSVLIDTGATESADFFPLRAVVDELIGDGELLVLHSHGHIDHVSADAQFADRPRTTVVPAEVDAVRSFFGFGADEAATVQLGGRTLDVIFTPGHQVAAVTFFDPGTGWLLTGDNVYPGRLYVRQPAVFADSIDRTIALAASRPVTHVLGCHIEMTTQPGVDYPVLTTWQPDEQRLEMTVDQLHDVRAALREVDGRPGEHVYPDFLICVV